MPPKKKAGPTKKKGKRARSSSPEEEGLPSDVDMDMEVFVEEEAPTPRTTRSAARKGKEQPPTRIVDGVDGDADDFEFDKSVLQKATRYDYAALMSNKEFIRNADQLVRKMDPQEFNMEYYESSGLREPLFFTCPPQELGMRMPNKEDFTVDTVLELVGGERIIEVVEVSNQASGRQDLLDFVGYYKKSKEERKVLYNVLSLEFSLTEMEERIRSPALVREIDWIDLHWPDNLKTRHIHFTRNKEKHTWQYTPTHYHPKVQNYCLMSVEECYTDFHIDFGGTSVWYHVLKGRKVFWLVRPTPSNMFMYEQYLKNVGDVGFFGNCVAAGECAVVTVEEGNTMIIPSGWIHAVFTPKDSLVFGGNFLHTLAAEMQFKVVQSENKISVGKKFRFPYLEELMFYTVSDFVKECTNRQYTRPMVRPVEGTGIEYVGKDWKAQGKHLQKVTYESHHTMFENGPVYVLPAASASIGADLLAPNEGGMHPVPEEQTSSPIPPHLKVKEEGDAREHHAGLEEEADDSEDEPHKDADPTATAASKEKADEGLLAPMKRDDVIYYDPAMYDLCGRGTAAHKQKVDETLETELHVNQDVLSTMSAMRCGELEKLVHYMYQKRIIDVPIGITRPASLLQAAKAVLTRRHEQVEAEGVAMDPLPWVRHRKTTSPAKRAPAKKRTVSDTTEGDAAAASQPSCSSSSQTLSQPSQSSQPSQEEPSQEEPSQEEPVKVEAASADADDVDDDPKDGIRPYLMKVIENPPVSLNPDFPEDFDLPFGYIENAEGATEEGEAKAKKEEPAAEGEGVDVTEAEAGEEAHADDSPPKKKPKKEASEKAREKEEKRVAREKEKAEKERIKQEKKKEKEAAAVKRRSSNSFEQALAGGGKAKTPRSKKSSSAQGPLVKDGVPMFATQDVSVANIYNYDPKNDIIKLGDAPLVSAYRKSTTNKKLEFNRNKYKLATHDHLDDEPAPAEEVSSPGPGPMSHPPHGGMGQASMAHQPHAYPPVHVETTSAQMHASPAGPMSGGGGGRRMSDGAGAGNLSQHSPVGPAAVGRSNSMSAATQSPRTSTDYRDRHRPAPRGEEFVSDASHDQHRAGSSRPHYLPSSVPTVSPGAYGMSSPGAAMQQQQQQHTPHGNGHGHSHKPVAAVTPVEKKVDSSWRASSMEKPVMRAAPLPRPRSPAIHGLPVIAGDPRRSSVNKEDCGGKLDIRDALPRLAHLTDVIIEATKMMMD